MRIFIILFLFCSFAQGQVVDRFTRFASAGAVFDGQNAADPTTEVNGAANTEDNHFGLCSWSSDTTPTPEDGSYVLKLTHDGATNVTVVGRIQMVGVSNGDNVTITMRVQEVTGGNWRIRDHDADGWTATGTAQNPAGGGWETINITADCDVDDPWIEVYTTTAGDGGDVIAIDNISIVIN